MDRQEFMIEQYISLRDEICQTKDRIFKTMGFGLLVVPGSNFLAQAYKLDTITLSLPILIVVVAPLYLSEENALMRCGRYIKHYIEPNVHDMVGWEEWLERRGNWNARDVDKHVSYAFYLLFLVYFIGSVFASGRFAINEYGAVPGAILLGAYIAIGTWFVIYLMGSLRLSTVVNGDVNSEPQGVRSSAADGNRRLSVSE
jgi:hypothetical protein